MKAAILRNIIVTLLVTLSSPAHVWAKETSASAKSILVEAESFDDYGGWSLDTQFMDQMGSTYLLAHGLGNPVKDAKTKVSCPDNGKYRVWVRTFDWVGRWRTDSWPAGQRASGDAPGRFAILIDNKPLDKIFGTEGAEWSWQQGPVINLKKGSFELAIKDLTGFEGRCDAVLFTKDMHLTPPNADPQMKQWRRQMLGLASEPQDSGTYDIVVVGGGISGICASLKAARLGCTVALIQDRPVLGGNNSSEVCVNLSGKFGCEPYAHVGDIVKQLQAPTPQYWHAGPFEDPADSPDRTRLELIRKEKNISLFLNHRANRVQVEGKRIKSVIAENVRTGKLLLFSGRTFADCTGDGCIGEMAGADYEITLVGHMGPTNLWSYEDTQQPAIFPSCPWALNLKDHDFPDPPQKLIGWYWESGFSHDPIVEGEYIRDWNFRAAYGAWDAAKNQQGRFKTHRLKWMSYISGKRESRRLLGDIILNRTDLEKSISYEDGCVPLTWNIDAHFPHPQYQSGFEGEEFIAKTNHIKVNSPYWMPYRCLYSRNIDNLFMAGRDISATQQALGMARVMNTTGMMGEIVGMAASICRQYDTNPRSVYKDHLEDLKKLMSQ